MKCYIDFMDSKNSFKKTRKDFKNEKEALNFMIKTFDTINRDFIHYY